MMRRAQKLKHREFIKIIMAKKSRKIRFAVRCVPQSIEAALQKAVLDSSNNDWLLLHQCRINHQSPWHWMKLFGVEMSSQDISLQHLNLVLVLHGVLPLSDGDKKEKILRNHPPVCNIFLLLVKEVLEESHFPWLQMIQEQHLS